MENHFQKSKRLQTHLLMRFNSIRIMTDDVKINKKAICRAIGGGQLVLPAKLLV